jgi:hypothetical protein
MPRPAASSTAVVAAAVAAATAAAAGHRRHRRTPPQPTPLATPRPTYGLDATMPTPMRSNADADAAKSRMP